MSLEDTLYPAVVLGLVLTSSSVLFSLLSLGLPGQQQCPQVISLLPPSALSALRPLCAFCARSTRATQQQQPVSMPSEHCPFTETQALPKCRPGWDSLCHLDSELSHFAFQLGEGWRECGVGEGKQAEGPPGGASTDSICALPSAYLRAASTGAEWWLSWASATAWPYMFTSVA